MEAEELRKALLRSPLFAGIAEADLPQLAACTGGRAYDFAGGERILPPAGETRPMAGVLLEGRALLRGEGGVLAPGDLFLIPPEEPRADGPACAMLFRLDRLLHTCGVSCPFHHRMVENWNRRAR